VGARAFFRLEAPGIAFGQWYLHAWFPQSPQHDGFVVWGCSVTVIRLGQAEIPDCLRIPLAGILVRSSRTNTRALPWKRVHLGCCALLGAGS
jgi:hypothetical protein